MKTFDEIREGYASMAQQRAVWATRKDGGKGHPDNKRKRKKEDVDEVKSADKKPEKYVASDGKTKIRMVPVVREQDEVNELDTSTLVSYRKKANKQRYSNNISKRTQRTAGVDRADKKLRKRNIDKFGDHSPKGVDKMGNRKEDSSDAVKAFLAKGGKIKKLPPAKAQGYHGKDDPGKGMHGMMDKPDTKAMGTRKKVKSMEDDDTARMYKDNPDMMKKGGPGGFKSLNKAGKKAVKKTMKNMGEAVKPTKAMHVFDNEKDARAKAKDIGGKYVKGTGKSDGKHAAIKEVSQDTKKSYIKKAVNDIDNRSFAQGLRDKNPTYTSADSKNNRKIKNRCAGINRALEAKETDPPFDDAKKISTTPTKDQFGNVIKNRAKSLARAAAKTAGGDMGDKQKKESLWDNIRKRRAAGKPKLKPGDKNYPKTLKIGEKTVNELDQSTMNSYHDKAQKSKDKATNSAVATILRKGDHSKDLKTMSKREKGMKMAKSRTIKKMRGDK